MNKTMILALSRSISESNSEPIKGVFKDTSEENMKKYSFYSKQKLINCLAILNKQKPLD